MLPKQQKYLENKLHAAFQTALGEYSKTRPTAHTQAEVTAKLLADGYVLSDRMYHYVQLPPTPAMVANLAAIDAFRAAGKAKLDEAIDVIYLGDDKSALDVLAQFIATLKELTR